MFRCGVGWDGIVAGALRGGLELVVVRSVDLVLRVLCQMLPLVASRWWSEPSLDHRITYVTSSSLAAMTSQFVSCSFGGVRLGSVSCPGRLSYGEWSEGCRPRKLRRVAYGVVIHLVSIITTGSPYPLYQCNVDGCCGGCYDEMVVRIALNYYSGLCHAGEEHTSSSPDSATHNKFATPRSSNSIFKFLGRHAIDCLMQEHRLLAAKALRHPSHVAGRFLGEVAGGLRTQSPEQQPGELPSPLGLRLGTSERGSWEVPPGSAPTTAQEDSGWRPGVAHREMSVASSTGMDPRTTGRAHRQKCIVERRGVENPRTTRGKVQRGLEDLESGSHRLRGIRCSSWAPSTLGISGFKFHSKPHVIASTLGIELLLPPDLGIGKDDCLRWTKRVESRVSHGCWQSSVPVIYLQRFGSVILLSIYCPGDGGMAEDMTLVDVADAPSPAQHGEWIGDHRILGLRNFFAIRFA